ncbi:MAG: PDDEXK nuclease domain-containing protein, partial [Flavobacteriia bacterium]
VPSSNLSPLLEELRILIAQSHASIAATVNSAMSVLYWELGHRINADILQNQRASYGQEVVSSLAKALSLEFGKGWSEKHIRHCLRAAETFQNKEIFYALSRELSWTHLRSVIYMEDALKRSFYIEMCRMEKWSTRILQERINSMLYERTSISKMPEQTIKNEIQALESNKELTNNLVFRDPYLLEFLGLQDTYSEKDLESAILVELQKFIIELGSDFAFMSRQKRITIDNEDYYLDLLFYHRRLKCLVAIELKLGKFEAAHKGQMELYLKWLEKYEQVEGENSPVGLILCASKNEEHIELLQLENSNIKVAEYLTQLPDMKVLEMKLNQAIERAKNKMNLDEQ